MFYASQGVRHAARKGSNALVHHGGHNGPGGSTTANPKSKSIHSVNHIRSALQGNHPPPNTFQAVRPRNPPHKLFTATRNVLQWFFTQLSTPGLRVPTSLAQLQGSGSRSLHSVVHRQSIHNRLSTPTRHALKNNALVRQANTFLPRSPGLHLRCGGVAQVGLGLARNFSSTRPIFQQLADNVPVAGRALYEIDWDVKMRKNHERMRIMSGKSDKGAVSRQEKIRPIQKKCTTSTISNHTEGRTVHNANFPEDIDHYFPSVNVSAVTTYLLIPLAPTPTLQPPLPLSPSPMSMSTHGEPTLLPPLSFLGDLHVSHSTHALRVASLFSRLDQANVWARGVHCSGYSHGQAHPLRDNQVDIPAREEGACTILRVDFAGWTKSEVRGVLGESGTGWCALEEVSQADGVSDDNTLSDNDFLSSGLLGSDRGSRGAFDTELGIAPAIDPAESFVLPTLDFSSSFREQSTSFSSPTTSANNQFIAEMEGDPWVDESSLSGSSSFDHLSDLVIDSPWFGPVYGPTRGIEFSSQFGWNADTECRGPPEYVPRRY